MEEEEKNRLPRNPERQNSLAKKLKIEFGGQPGIWAYAESPLLDGDVLVVTPGGAQATLMALNKKTGAVIWKSAVPGGDAAAYASAIVVRAGGRKQYVQFLSKGIVGVDAKTGEFLWRYAETVKGMAQMVTPVARGEYVYGGAHQVGGGLVRLKPDGGGVVAEQVYFARGHPISIGGAVLVGDYLYGTAAEGLVAVEFTTGKIKWQAESIGTLLIQLIAVATFAQQASETQSPPAKGVEGVGRVTCSSPRGDLPRRQGGVAFRRRGRVPFMAGSPSGAGPFDRRDV